MTRLLIIILSAFVALSARAAPAITVNGSAGTATVNPGTIMTIAVTGGPANPLDWVGFYPLGGNLMDWRYLTNDAYTQPATGVSAGTVHILVPTNALGSYLVRFNANNGNQTLASNAVVVAAKPTVAQQTKEITWVAGHDLMGVPIGEFPQAATIQSVNCRVEAPVGAVATFFIVKAPSGTPLTKGAQISSACNGNATSSANQNLFQSAIAVNAGDTIGLVTTNGANWIAGNGMGLVTVGYSAP